MKLIDVLLITSDYTTVRVIGVDSGKELGVYDGKNAIDSKLNDLGVIRQSVQDNELHIFVAG